VDQFLKSNSNVGTDTYWLSPLRRPSFASFSAKSFATTAFLLSSNVLIKRLWRSVRYKIDYLRTNENGTQLRRGLTEYFTFGRVSSEITDFNAKAFAIMESLWVGGR
jgi:hypothetical protein